MAEYKHRILTHTRLDTKGSIVRPQFYAAAIQQFRPHNIISAYATVNAPDTASIHTRAVHMYDTITCKNLVKVAA